MKLKLDENLGVRGLELLSAAGHDVCTVPIQQLGSATDEEIAARCRAEGRAIVTLDLDFANPLRFPPQLHPGIAVPRAASRMTPEILDRLIASLIGALKTLPLDGQLWIVEEGRIGVFEPSL